MAKKKSKQDSSFIDTPGLSALIFLKMLDIPEFKELLGKAIKDAKKEKT